MRRTASLRPRRLRRARTVRTACAPHPTPPSLALQEAVVEAGRRTGVARGSDLVDENEQRVTVAVDAHLSYVLDVAGGLALDPVFLSAAAPQRRPSGGEGTRERGVVHPRD